MAAGTARPEFAPVNIGMTGQATRTGLGELQPIVAGTALEELMPAHKSKPRGGMIELRVLPHLPRIRRMAVLASVLDPSVRGLLGEQGLREDDKQSGNESHYPSTFF